MKVNKIEMVDITINTIHFTTAIAQAIVQVSSERYHYGDKNKTVAQGGLFCMSKSLLVYGGKKTADLLSGLPSLPIEYTDISLCY